MFLCERSVPLILVLSGDEAGAGGRGGENIGTLTAYHNGAPSTTQQSPVAKRKAANNASTEETRSPGTKDPKARRDARSD